jgi:hypothetical protein
MAAIANPTLNSYKRLIPHYEAPIYLAWAPHNRSSLIRIPAKKNVDVEIRNADPAANPYLFFAALIHAGLDGIKKKITYEPITVLGQNYLINTFRILTSPSVSLTTRMWISASYSWRKFVIFLRSCVLMMSMPRMILR